VTQRVQCYDCGRLFLPDGVNKHAARMHRQAYLTWLHQCVVCNGLCRYGAKPFGSVTDAINYGPLLDYYWPNSSTPLAMCHYLVSTHGVDHPRLSRWWSIDDDGNDVITKDVRVE